MVPYLQSNREKMGIDLIWLQILYGSFCMRKDQNKSVNKRVMAAIAIPAD